MKLSVDFAVVVVGKGAWVRRKPILRRQLRMLPFNTLVVEVVKVLQRTRAEGKKDHDQRDGGETAQRVTVWPLTAARVNPYSPSYPEATNGSAIKLRLWSEPPPASSLPGGLPRAAWLPADRVNL